MGNLYNAEILGKEENEFTIEEDKSIYEKEYTKLKNKLSKKYSNEELEYRIKISLYKKGFNQNND